MSFSDSKPYPKYWSIGIYHEELEEKDQIHENLAKEALSLSFKKANKLEILFPKTIVQRDQNLGGITETFQNRQSQLSRQESNRNHQNQLPRVSSLRNQQSHLSRINSLRNQQNEVSKEDFNQQNPDQIYKDDFIKTNQYELLIAVTMYNEGPELFKKTMLAINKNIQSEKFIYDRKKVAVVVIVDGIKAFYENSKHECYKSLFNLKDIFKINDITSEKVKEKDKECIEKLLKKDYERETLVDKIDSDKHVKIKAEKLIGYCFVNDVEFEEGLGEIKVYFCVKQKNKGKLNSHLWFFRGFCKHAKPEIVLFIDVGTEPKDNAIGNLCRAFKDKDVAGVCGEIIPKIKEEHLTDLLYQTQVVEYKFAHIFDKAFESLIGYITVLPGAFSAYRYEALMPKNVNGPLWSYYFKSIRQPLNSCYMSNIYLAEDRVLCMALVTCEGKKNILKYVKSAKAYTDPPTAFNKLISQRRRWINGSWFALIDIIIHICNIWKSGHIWWRKPIFTLMVFYYAINVLYSFFIIGGFYLSLSICLRKQFPAGDDTEELNGIGKILITIYLLLLIANVVLSLGSNIQSAERAFWTLSLFYALYMIAYIWLLLIMFDSYLGSMFVWIPVVAILGSYIIFLLLNKCLFTVLKGIVQYLLATPTYINIFTIYAVCNVHDCTWGNRPGEAKTSYELYRAYYVSFWFLLNSGFAYSFDALNTSGKSYSISIYWIGMGGLFAIAFRFLFALIFMIKEYRYKMNDLLDEKKSSSHESRPSVLPLTTFADRK
ncbi:hypothetical protein SteCoe_22152 [Stentor coeruleus]|uniref:chitin synthase n=1 Tax=Stentor coeruleus TaxID=5963 RepID=A0A1R2BMZ0_9CILI|nr:hypothetical protein SteCoe_22152 [Stentor coeruleus]